MDTLYMLKCDDDEVQSHPWTVVRWERRETDNAFMVTGVIQMTSLETAATLVRQLQREEIEWDNILTVV